MRVLGLSSRRWAFRCPERKGEADFLQEVTSRRDQAVRCACA